MYFIFHVSFRFPFRFLFRVLVTPVTKIHVDMRSAHVEEHCQKIFEMSTLKLDGASRNMHLNFRRRWDII